jgi:DNA-binding response OmpR family regulator
MEERVRDQPGRGRDAGDEQQEGAAKELVCAELPGRLCLDEEGHQIVARRTASFARDALHVGAHAVAGRQRHRWQRALTGRALEHVAEPREQHRMVRVREAEPGEHRAGRQGSSEVVREVGTPGVGETVDQLVDLRAHGGLEPGAERRRTEGVPERAAEPCVKRRIGGRQVAGREEQLVGIVDVITGAAGAARERLPVLRGGHDVVEACQDPHIATFVVVARGLAAQAPIGGVRIVEWDERVPLDTRVDPHQWLRRHRGPRDGCAIVRTEHATQPGCARQVFTVHQRVVNTARYAQRWMARTILVVEDEPTLRETIVDALESEGFRVVAAADGREALTQFRGERPDLVLLDLMLPELSGIEVTRIIRAESGVPIVMLTAKDSELDKVVGLELGADDYVTKPFSLRELTARIRALFRRSEAAVATGSAPTIVDLGRVQADLGGHRLLRDGDVLPIKPKAFELLAFLIRNPGQVFTRDQLLEKVWGYDYAGETRTVDVHVHWLRSQIEEDPGQPAFIHTVRGVGYVFRRPT